MAENLNRHLAAIEALVIDVDGVLVRGAQAMPGVGAFFATLRQYELRYVLATNNATVTPEMLAERLQSLGIAVEPAAVLTAAQATTAYLLSELPSGAGLFVIGEAPLRNALQDAGFELLPTAQGAQAVVVGLDRRADWDKLTEAALAIQDGAVFIGTNPDRSLPVERGLAIGNGALLAAIQAATDVAPAIVGKPEPHLFRLALRRLGTEPSHTVALGDRLETDILGGQRAGLRTALVLTGASSRELLQGSAVKPDWVFDDLHAFSLALKQAR